MHPAVDDIERRCLAWLDRFDFCDNDVERAWLRATNSAEFLARLSPTGTVAGIAATAAWVYWGFAFDDRRCDSGAMSTSLDEFVPMALRTQRALEDLGGTTVSDDPFTTALVDIGRTLRQLAPPTQVRRFVDGHRAWLTGVIWQIANRAGGRMPTLNDFAAQRLNSSGGPPTIALLELAGGLRVPTREFESPAVRALTEMTALIAGWDNDLVSYQREQRHAHTDQNLVSVVAHGGSTDRAMVAAVGARDRVMRRFLELRAETVPRVATDTRCYLDNLGNTIRGNIDWALRVPRYTSLSDPGELPVAGAPLRPGWVERPSDTDIAPLPLPAVAWWWDDLT